MFMYIRVPMSDAEPGGLEGLLRVHVELEHVEQHLHMTLGLHEPAHHSVAGQQLTYRDRCCTIHVTLIKVQTCHKLYLVSCFE